MPSNTVKYFSCIYCGAGFIAVEPYDRHTKANKCLVAQFIIPNTFS